MANVWEPYMADAIVLRAPELTSLHARAGSLTEHAERRFRQRRFRERSQPVLVGVKPLEGGALEQRFEQTVITLNAVTTVFDLLRQVANAPTAEGLSYKLRGRVFLAN